MNFAPLSAGALLNSEHVPFGGVKQSGLSREASHFGMDDYVEAKYLCMGDILK
jgi:succinate-semialdehyde dehydrogenase/glutarate-semialdehyde dehydrogenase